MAGSAIISSDSQRLKSSSMSRIFLCVLGASLHLVILPATASQGNPQRPARPARAEIIAAARDIVQKARYCSLITIAGDGHAQARIVDPLEPDADFTIWIATNPLTRKVREIQRNPRTTVLCFDAATSGYVTIVGRAALVTDATEKQKHWKDDWAAIYPKGARDGDFMLIRVTPLRLEIVSESRGMVGDPKTWRPLAIDFPTRLR